MQLGLNKNFNDLQDKKDVVSFALNAVRDSSSGDMVAYSSEPGNELSYSFPDNYSIIGNIYGEDDTNYIFSTDNTNSEIGSFKDGVYTQIINTACLNFNKCNKITGEYRIVRGCDRKLYFNDGVNSDKAINLDNLDLYRDDCNIPNSWNCNKMNLSPDIVPICVNIESVNDHGGELLVGKYYFMVEILDADKNVVNKSNISLPVNINDGGYNIVSHQIEIGGIPPVNKSIDIKLTNLPEDMAYVKLYAIRAITGDGFTLDSYSVGSLYSISGAELNITYTGINVTNGDTPVDYNELIAQLPDYESSEVMEQVQNRLIRANLKESVKDYSNFQTFASRIGTTYDLEPGDDSSYMPDEIYAHAIVYINEDGSESPSFHIPGRCKETSDSDIINAAHIDNFLNENVERHLLYNTADTTNKLAYYECDINYEQPKNCCIEDYWGVDICGNSIVDTPIRHTRMPDKGIVGNNVIHLNFSNIVYPSGIVGHYIVRAIQTDADKTVLDHGIMGPLKQDGIEIDNTTYTYHGFQYFNNRLNSDKVWLFTPKFLFCNEYLNPTYIKVEEILLTAQTGNNNPIKCERVKKTQLGQERVDAVLMASMLKIVPPSRMIQNITFTDNVIINPGEKYELDNGEVFANLSIDNKMQFLSLDNTTNVYQQECAYTVALKVHKKVYCNLNNLQYTKANSCINETVMKGDIYSTDVNITNTVFYKFENGLLDNILRIVLIAVAAGIGTILTILSAGTLTPVAIAIVAIAYVGIAAEALTGLLELFANGVYDPLMFRSDYDDCYQDVDPEFQDRLGILTQHFRNLKLHSEINVVFRHDGNLSKHFNSDNVDFLLEYMKSRFIEVNDSVPDDITSTFNFSKPQYYFYNKDYSKPFDLNVKFPLDTTVYPFCSSCNGLYPNRIVFSPVSRSEELQDFYRVNLAADYIDLPAHRGPITGIKFIRDRLLVHTTQTTFILKPNPQQLAADQTTVYIQTGDFLGIPEIELIQTDLGYAGSQSRIGYLNCEYGYFWVDQKNRSIFKYTNKIEEISRLGLDQWFKTNLKQCDTSICDPINIIYDNRYDRVLFSKSDSKCCRWTLSFSTKYNSWSSFHSYIPDYYFNDRRFFYSSLNNQIYKHLHEDKYTNFYTFKYPFIVEYNTPYQYLTKDLQTVFYVNTPKYYDVINNKWISDYQETFNKIWVYNDCESTGLQDLVYINQQSNPYGNVISNVSNPTVIQTDQNYKVSGLYDFATNPLICSSACNQIEVIEEPYFDVNRDQGYLDQVPINVTVPNNHYEYKSLNSKNIYVRLIYDKDVNIKQFLQFSLPNGKDSIR